jgi:hypothetical protein
MREVNVVLIFGSAPDVTSIRHWDLSFFTSRIAINNAWQVTPEWDYLIYPEDFPIDRRPHLPVEAHQQIITANEFVLHQNNFGGFIYAGGTMAFTAGYWALGALKPDIIAYVGCDMVYTAQNGTSSHFYGSGTADPLRNDMTLQSLEAKSNRLMALANKQNCAILNMSALPETRLTFPRSTPFDFQHSLIHSKLLAEQNQSIDPEKVSMALEAEKKLGYMVSSGRYWERMQSFDPVKLRMIDDIWMETFSGSDDEPDSGCVGSRQRNG